ncbi:MAG: hypothetical protein DMG57_34495 [Acidobacteria bacterium]|nr:MAG: hypothetical protein DMG57_34495 [Acidobacteriota bacterium]
MSAARRHSYYFWSPVLSKAYSVSLVIVLYLLFAAYNICATRPQTRRRSLANRLTSIWYMFLAVALACPTIGVAASYVAGPGQTFTLSSSIVLSAGDTVDLVGTAANPCAVQGNNFGFQANDSTWSGRLVIKNCSVQNLGSAANHALQLTLMNAAYLDIENTTWTTSSSVDLRTFGTSTITFSGNIVSDSSTFPVQKDFVASRPFFNETGTSASQKFFQSNKIYKGGMYVTTPNWIIGGDADSDGNIIIGPRARISATGAGCVIKSNYIHASLAVDPVNWYWGQVVNISLGSGSRAENNVFRTAQWVARQIDGEFRNNLILEVNGHYLLQAGRGTVHHNIFTGLYQGPTRYGDTSPTAAIALINEVYTTDGLQFYNNTMDATNVAGVGVELPFSTFIPAVRSNVFYGFSTQRAIVGAGSTEAITTPLPSRLGYADYNLFHYVPGSPVIDNYAVGVGGKSERVDPGFAYHDVHVGGPMNERLDPQFRGPLPSGFPFTDDDIQNGVITVSQILSYYQYVYSPAPGSPLIGAGDPADGVGNDIGAVQSSTITSVPPLVTTNKPPVVNAGPDFAITLPATASLGGYALDDSLPVGTLTLAWSKASGPGTISFSNPASGYTTATFSQSGTYTLRLTASDGALSGSDDLVITVSDSTTPSAPSFSSFTATPGSITAGQSSTLAWTTSGATSVAITPGTFTSTAASGSTTVSPTATTTYTLTASNAGGSTNATATVTLLAPDVTPPTVPTNLSASAASSSSITLSWSASTDPVVSGQVTSGVAGYKIYRGTSASSLSVVTTVSTTSYVDSGLTASTTYYYSVAAADTAGNSSAQVSPLVPAITPAPSQTVTVTFQHGANGYTSGEDNEVDIGRSNPNNVYASGGTVYPFAIGLEYCTSYPCEKMIIRFKNLGISGTITNVQLQVKEYYQQGGSNFVYAQKISKPDWDTNAVNWYNYKTGTAWTTPGGDSGPRLATVSAPGAGQWASIDLGANFSLGELQQNGIILTTDVFNYYNIWFYCNEATNPADRPKLIVTYIPGAAGQPPAISSFTATPTSITANQSATLAWTTSGATSIAITPGTFTSTAASGSTTVSPTTTTTYTLTAGNSNGSATASATVTVSPAPQPPVISAIAASSTSSGATITWTTNTPSSSQVDYGPATPYTQSTTADPTLVTSHSVIISGLSSSTLYHFRVKSADASNTLGISGDNTFTTLGATYTAGPGQTFTLAGNLSLAGSDTVDFIGAAGNPCVVQGGQFQILATDGTWSGHLAIKNCTVQNLGTSALPAIHVNNYGKGYIDVENTDFESSSDIQIGNLNSSTTTFNNNILAANSVFPVDKDLGFTRNAFLATQMSSTQKYFQGNGVYRGTVMLQSPNWTVGGDSDALGNLIIGFRAGLQVLGSGCVVKHNYTHVNLGVDPVVYPYFTQVMNFELGAGSLAENNVIRTGHWVTRQIDGEFRNNVVLEVQAHQFLQAGAGTIHHNIYAHIYPGPNRFNDLRVVPAESLVNELYATDGFQFYNNTLDARGISNLGVELPSGTFMPSLRNNIFYGVSTTAAVIAPRFTETLTDPGPARLGYADYNDFFYDPASPVRNNYALSVAGLTERSTGFAYDDLPVGGPMDTSVDPMFKGPLPTAFPFNDADIISGAVTVSQILAYYRDVYGPAPGSPVIGAGNPADGPGTSIGAVEVGPDTGPDQTPPTVTTNLVATANSPSTVALSWSPSIDPVVAGQSSTGVAGYRIYRGASPAGLTQIATTTAFTYFDTAGLSASTTYYYSIAAFDEAGNLSTQSALVPTTTLALVPTVVTYQHGVNSYTGGEDNEIDMVSPTAVYSSGGSSYPYQIGVMFCAAPCNNMLIRFKNLGIRGTITNVKLKLKEYGQQGGGPNYVYAQMISQPDWDTNVVNWTVYKTGTSWISAGGDSGPVLAAGSAPGAGQWITIDLGANFTVAQLEQNGIMIITDIASYYDLWFYNNEATLLADRPTLVVTYTPN